MGIPVIAFGKSGAGKSYSLKNFGKDELVFFNCLGKPLPFKGKFNRTAKVLDPAKILGTIDRLVKENDLKSFVIDDAGYIMTSLFMNGHRDKRGGNSFDLYNEIGDTYWQLFRGIMNLPEDVIVYLMMHESTNDYGECRLRTIGRLLEDKVCIEGMCTIVLHAIVDDNGHRFRVQANSGDIAKSPAGMFETDSIPNDLKAVDTAIRNYYEMRI